MKKRDLTCAAGGAMLAILVASGIAWAAIPGAGGAIDGCYQKNEGLLRVIDPATAACRSSEVPISWSAQGVEGVKGPAGAPGPHGANGRDGVDASIEQEAPGANCPTGGVKVTGANGVTFVCNVLPPDSGLDG
jgi:hypothetical protein